MLWYDQSAVCSMGGRQPSPSYPSGSSPSSWRNACAWAQQQAPSLLRLVRLSPRWLLLFLVQKETLSSASVPYGCCKLPQTGEPKAAGIYSLTAPEPTRSKSVSFDWNWDVGSATLPPGALRETSSLAVSTFWWLLVLLGLWHHRFSAVSNPLSVSLIRTFVIPTIQPPHLEP